MAHELLVVGAGTPALHQLTPVLRQAGCHVHRIEQAAAAVELLQGTRFDVVIAHHPLSGVGLDEFVAAVRSEGSPCRDSGLLLVVAAAAVDEVSPLLRHGVNRIVAAEAACDKALDAIADLLGRAPRRSLRAVVQLELWLAQGVRRQLTVTENLSATGMLVCGATEFPVGSHLHFELLVPGVAPPILGEVEVARHTDHLRERIEGFGGRIVSFVGDGQTRLRSLFAER